jgi:polyferredoxin
LANKNGNLSPIYLPLAIGLILSLVLGMTVWKWFYIIFSSIGLFISIGNWIQSRSVQPDLGRRVSLLLIMPIFIVFFGFLQRENMQLEETVFYGAFFLAGGVFTRVLIHYSIAKVFGPLLFGRGFCGWACWTAAILDWLPIKENHPIPAKYTWLRWPVLAVSILLPFYLIRSGYDYMGGHIRGDAGNLIQTHKWDQFLWFLAGNALYYLSGVLLAYAFGKRRAFCKIACPVSLVMKIPARFSIIRKGPSGENCTGCGKCNKECPMDVDVRGYIQKGLKILSTECILCGKCVQVCPTQAIH